jgi:hypothetical protein
MACERYRVTTLQKMASALTKTITHLAAMRLHLIFTGRMRPQRRLLKIHVVLIQRGQTTRMLGGHPDDPNWAQAIRVKL